MAGGENGNGGKPVKKGGWFKKIMLWSAGGMAVLLVIGAILPKKEKMPQGGPETATEQAAESPTTTSSKRDAAPLAELELIDYLAKCQGVPKADFNRDCLGKQVVWVLSFTAGLEDPRVLMNRPGDFDTRFWVSFNELPAWGERGPASWTGRRVSVAATVGAPGDGILLENARVIPDETWRDRAIELVRARDGVLDAMWPQQGGISFWVAMRNTGQSRDKEAAQLCGELWRAGRPADYAVMVTILDATRISQQVEIGKARCSS